MWNSGNVPHYIDENYTNTHWYRFQEAVKQHQDETLAILMESNLKGLELPEL